MEILRDASVLLHLIGFAALFGGSLVQLRSSRPEVNAAMLHGAWIELLTGGVLVALDELDGTSINYPQTAVKLTLALIIMLLVGKNRKFQSIPRGLLGLIAGMTLINAGLGTLWH
ncbi:MAG: hypothetical protein H0T91_03315 [Propionibacteriaceae bacterium]|nr:hypothetical protein [Propionibacteriaceae bacterium]